MQDLLDKSLGKQDIDDLKLYYLSQFDIYIGDFRNWTQNLRCTEAPLLAANYKDRLKTWDGFDGKGSLRPDYGFNKQCNLPGRYVTLVGNGVPTESITLCSVLITGNKYVRDTEPEDTIEVITS